MDDLMRTIDEWAQRLHAAGRYTPERHAEAAERAYAIIALAGAVVQEDGTPQGAFLRHYFMAEMADLLAWLFWTEHVHDV